MDISFSPRLFTTMPRSGSGAAEATRSCTSSWLSGRTSSSSRRSTRSHSPRFKICRHFYIFPGNFSLSRILSIGRPRRLRQPGVVHLHGVAPRGAADVGVPEHEHVDVEPPGDEGEREEGEVDLNCLVKGGLLALNHEKDLIRTLLKNQLFFRNLSM